MYESDQVIAFEDINKVAPVHVLVAPKVHLESIIELKADDVSLLSELHKAILAVAQKSGVDQSGFRVVTNRGKSAGQSVFHLHYHVIGGRNLEVTLG